jgi:hypothetical protein
MKQDELEYYISMFTEIKTHGLRENVKDDLSMCPSLSSLTILRFLLFTPSLVLVPLL